VSWSPPPTIRFWPPSPPLETVTPSFFYGNLINQLGRMPRAASQTGEAFLLEMVNNVVYNWGTGGDWGTRSTVSSQEYAD
jgi:hypothetical protein